MNDPAEQPGKNRRITPRDSDGYEDRYRASYRTFQLTDMANNTGYYIHIYSPMINLDDLTLKQEIIDVMRQEIAAGYPPVEGSNYQLSLTRSLAGNLVLSYMLQDDTIHAVALTYAKMEIPPPKARDR